MRNNLTILLSSAVIALTFSVAQTSYGSEQFSTPEEQKKSSAIQLQMVADDHLEAVLGTGNNVLLKINIGLKPLKNQLNKEKLETPAQLFLTDFTSSPTNHPAVGLKVNIDCEPTTPTYTLPNKPPSFDSYGQFTEWLSQGYFTNQLSIAYDFHLDPRIAASSLMPHLFPYTLSPGGYHITGTHIIPNAKINPDDCVPKLTYVSKRGTTNTTTATLAGTLYLNKVAYPIDDHHQTFPHPKMNETLYKRDEIKTLHSRKWLAQAEIITKITYAEFPNDRLQHWPNAPSGTYSFLRRHFEDLGKNDHVACWDGTSGEKVDIADGRVFSVVHDAISVPEGSQFLDSIVKDNDGNLYTLRYKATTISSLPDDVRAIIFSFLTQQKDLLRAGAVSKGWRQAAEQIWKNKPLELSNRPLSQEDYKALAQGPFSSLILRDMPIRKEEAHTISLLSKLVYLNLVHNNIGAEEMKAIANGNLSSLTTLIVRSNSTWIGAEGAKWLANGNLSALRFLSLAYTNMGDAGVKWLANGNLSALTTLDLADTIGDEGAKAVANGNLSSLTSLTLCSHSIGTEGAKAIANINLPKLTKLALHWNPLGDEGAKWLANGNISTTLRSLYLGYTNIGDEGVKWLANGKLSALTELGLDQTTIGDEAAKAIANGNLSRLTTLTVSSTRIGKEGKEALAKNVHLKVTY